MAAYYNEIDPFAAQWLRNLISAGHIAPGDVDERSIVDVRADDLRGYEQCHFFAGIGGWSIALRQAGWSDDRSVWTGSCPCQPFSAAGAGKAFSDERHLWPAWFSLIEERQPATVFGEQVEAAVGWGWLDAVFSDLEGEGYACGATVLPASGVGAPHIRQRLWFVADTSGIGTGRDPRDAQREAPESDSARDLNRSDFAGSNVARSTARGMADANGRDASAEGLQRGGQHGQRAQDGRARRLENAELPEEERYRQHGGQRIRFEEAAGFARSGGCRGWWRDADWLLCTDQKYRPVGPGSFPLGHGIQRRASKLRAYGNAIVPQVATEFIVAACAAIGND